MARLPYREHPAADESQSLYDRDPLRVFGRLQDELDAGAFDPGNPADPQPVPRLPALASPTSVTYGAPLPRPAQPENVVDVWRICDKVSRSDELSTDIARVAMMLVPVRSLLIGGQAPAAYHIALRLLQTIDPGERWFSEVHQVYANLGYACISLGWFEEAVFWLRRVHQRSVDFQRTHSDATPLFRIWHVVALAYAYLGWQGDDHGLVTYWIGEAHKDPELRSEPHLRRLYPELAEALRARPTMS